MTFSISAFRASIQSGLARKCNFQVICTPPSTLAGADLMFRATGATIPGRQVMTVDNLIYGPPRKIAYNQTFAPVSLTFLQDPDLPELNVFKTWQDFAVGFARGYNGPRTGMWDVGYYDDYKGRIEIKMYDDNGVEQYKCELVDAYPLRVGDLQLDWGSDDFLTLSVEFTYHYLIDETYTTPSTGDTGLPI